MEFITDFNYSIENINQMTEITVVFLILSATLSVILRIILCICYQSNLLFARFSKKDRKSRLIRKILNNYKDVEDRGISNINIEQIVNKNILKLNFIGFNLNSIDELVKKIESQLGIIGVASFFIPSTDKMLCAIATATVIMIFWVFGSIFNYNLTKIKLISEVVDYIDNREGISDKKDLATIIVTLKNDLQSAMLNTDKILTDEIHKLSSNINESFKYGTESIVKIVNSSMNNITSYADILNEPIEKWKLNIEAASTAQNSLNLTVTELKDAMSKFESIYEQIDRQLNTQNDNIKDMASQIGKQVEQFCSVVYTVDESIKSVSLNSQAVQNQLKYIDNNQKVLDSAVQKYQGAMEELTSNIGQAFGNIINIYSHNASENINSEVEKVIDRLAEINREFLENVNKKIDIVSNQNLIQQQTILDLKDNLLYKNQTEVN